MEYLNINYLLQKPANFEEARQVVAESVEIYNANRPHIALKYKTPNEVHQAFYSWNKCQPILGLDS